MELVWIAWEVCLLNLVACICWLLGIANSYACHDANKDAQSGKILRIFHYQVGAVTNIPPLQESRPEILCLSEEGGVFLTKTSFSLPSGFFFGTVRPLDF